MAVALGYHATDLARGSRLCFHLKPGSYDTTALIEVQEQLKVFYRGEQVVLVWNRLSAHWNRAMRAWVAEQDWLTLKQLPAYAPEPNPVAPLRSSLKKRESPPSPATTLPTSPNKASTASTRTSSCPAPTSPTPIGAHARTGGRQTVCLGRRYGRRRRCPCTVKHPVVWAEPDDELSLTLRSAITTPAISAHFPLPKGDAPHCPIRVQGSGVPTIDPSQTGRLDFSASVYVAVFYME
ncbi:transposase [Streptomyces sp. NPDC048362]|uniref:transposase n=1 Tax=Streptomyces sp. NPDC048362 TaxID=3365539 RepID=UPI003717B1B2